MRKECQTGGRPGALARLLVLLGLALAWTLCLGWPGSAWAQASAAAVELQRAEEALARGDAAAAIPSLETAYFLRPGPRTLRLLVDALVKERRYAYALEALARLRLLSHGADREAAERQMEQLAPLLQTHLRVVSEPEGATVYLDGDRQRPLGTTPLYTAVPPGKYQVVVSAPGYVSRTLPVEVPPGGEAQLRAELLLIGCDLDLRSEPPGAAVQVLPAAEGSGAPQQGQAPLRLRVPPGTYRIEMDLPGRAGVVQPLSCRGDEVLALRGVLPALPLGRLTVAAQRGALVQVDFCPGYDRDHPPRCAPAPQPLHGGTAEMLPGRHRIDVTQEGHRPWQGEGLVNPGEETVVNVPPLALLPVLPPSPPAARARPRPRSARPSRKALIWTVAGVVGTVVLGGIGTALVLTGGGTQEARFPAVLVR